MKSIIAWTVRNEPAMNALVFAVMIIGFISFNRMRREVFPEFELEIALVTGKQAHDKRQSIKDRDWQRQRARLLSHRR